jgi:hypothetical protein
MNLPRWWLDLHFKTWSQTCLVRELGDLRKTTTTVAMTSPHMLITRLALTSLNNISQSQLVILRDVTKTKRSRTHKLHRVASNARPWRLLNAPTKIKSTTPRACAITATTNTVETATPMLALTQTDLSMLKGSVRTVILMTITSSREDLRKIKLPPVVSSNSSMTILSLRDLSSENHVLRGHCEDAHQTFYQYRSDDIFP